MQIPPYPSCGEMTPLSFTQELSQQLSLAQERALPGLGTHLDLWHGLVSAGKDPTPLLLVMQGEAQLCWVLHGMETGNGV